MIRISLKQHDNTVDAYFRGDGKVYAGGSIALNCAAAPVETIYHGPGRWRRAIPSPPGILTRMFYPPGDREWADTPEVRPEWRVQSDAKVHGLSVTKDDIDSYALVTDTAQLWRLEAVNLWVKAGYLPRIFPNSPTLTDKPLLVMSLRFDDDPGVVAVNFETPVPSSEFQNAVTLLFEWNDRGTYTVRSGVEEVLLDTIDDTPDDMQEAVDMALQLLQVDPPAADQARLLLLPHRSDNQ